MSNDHDGFSNYPTWHTALVIQNDEHAYRWANEMAQDVWANTQANEHFDRRTLTKWALADLISQDLDGAQTLEGIARTDTNAAALLGWAFRQVEWNEIAASIMDDLELHEDNA